MCADPKADVVPEQLKENSAFRLSIDVLVLTQQGFGTGISSVWFFPERMNLALDTSKLRLKLLPFPTGVGNILSGLGVFHLYDKILGAISFSPVAKLTKLLDVPML